MGSTMTDKTEAQPEALRLADALHSESDRQSTGVKYSTAKKSATELRRQHAEIQQLKAQLSARQAAPDWIEDLAQSWDECMYDAPGEMIDIGASIRKAASRAAPPPPERGPLTDEQIDDIFRSMYGCEPDANAEFSDVCRRVEAAHGIGATND